MQSHFLKRILPFALTLIAGALLGGATNFLSFRGAATQSAGTFYAPHTFERPYSCASRKRAMFGMGSGVGRLVRIERQAPSGEWVRVRPVGPEIYDVTTRPAIIRAEPATHASYTEAARDARVTGRITLEATLSPDGLVTDVTPRNQLSDGLTAKAVLAARKLDFEPAVVDGEPVAQRVLLEYEFSL